MTTLRIARRRQFVRLDSRAVNDTRLSYRARGVLAWLLEKPDDWTVNAEAISAKGKEGRDAIRTALGELEQAGYLVRRKWRGDDGQWRSEAVVYEHPELSDHDGFPAVDNQRRETGDGNPGLVLNGSKEPDSTHEETHTVAVIDDDGFERFWQAYPRKTAKAAAQKVWNRAVKAATKQRPDYAIGSIIDGAIRYAEDPNRQDTFTAHASTWLNQERWNDPPLPARTASARMQKSNGTRQRIAERLGTGQTLRVLEP